MSRRIELELTSAREDGSWTWRAAGALQPRGELDGTLLPQGVKVGDVLRADADFTVDGITVVSVLPPKSARVEPERIELKPAAREFQPVVTTLAPRTERRGRSDRGDRDFGGGDRPDRARRDGPRPDGPRPGGPRPDGPRRDDRDRTRTSAGPRPAEGADRPSRGPARPPRRERPAPPPPKPKAKKLRPGHVNRDALLATLPPEHHPIADQLFRGGIPAVRAAINEQNTKAKAEGQPEIPEATVLALAENLAPAVRLAEWLDRAAAAVADAEVIALKDLRAVVLAADDVVREDATRPLVAELRAVLDRRATTEQQEWIQDITQSLSDGRVVRALRLASRAPQPNETLPAELATRLSDAAGAALTSDALPERWATVLDAIAYSPVRRSVEPVGAPAEPGDELLAAVRKHAARVPKVATLFGIEAPKRTAPAPKPKTAPRRAADVQAEAGLLPPPGARRIPPPPPSPTAGEPAVSAEVSAPSEPIAETSEPAADAVPEAVATEVTPVEPVAVEEPVTASALSEPEPAEATPEVGVEDATVAEAPAVEAASDVTVAEAPAAEADPVEAEPDPVPEAVVDEPAPTVSEQSEPVSSYEPPVTPLDEGTITTADPLEPIALAAPQPAAATPADDEPSELSSSGD